MDKASNIMWRIFKKEQIFHWWNKISKICSMDQQNCCSAGTNFQEQNFSDKLIYY